MAFLKRILIFIFLLWALVPGVASAQAPVVRVKDISHILEARDNQLMGFGLVAGLRNTGDSGQTGFTKQALSNLLNRMGVVPREEEFRSRNVAAVMVVAQIPPYLKSGQKIDVWVSSLGDATSLRGGTLLMTPLKGADDQVYVVSQGSITVGGRVDSGALPTLSSLIRTQETVGRVPQGGLVEKQIPVTFASKNHLTIVLEQPDFTTAHRVETAIQEAGLYANATDAGTVVVGYRDGTDVVGLMAQVENLKVRPDSIAKVVVSERTGTVVVGENVRLASVAVAHGDIHVRIGDVSLYSGSGQFGTTQVTSRLGVGSEGNEKLVQIQSGASLGSLVKALNAIGASPKDLIAILEAIRAAGALPAQLEII